MVVHVSDAPAARAAVVGALGLPGQTFVTYFHGLPAHSEYSLASAERCTEVKRGINLDNCKKRVMLTQRQGINKQIVHRVTFAIDGNSLVTNLQGQPHGPSSERRG